MTRSRSILVVLFVVLLAGVAAYTLQFWPSGAGTPNVIVISLDTCRADHLGCYGYPEGITPHIDAIAREGILFANVITPVPLTLPAHCSMLTGTIPPYHGVHDNLGGPLPDSSVTLAEVLRQNGYHTAGVVGAMVLASQTGISQGFDIFSDRFNVGTVSVSGMPERPGGEVSRVANAWLNKRAKEPFFLFVHYFDPHHPYEPPEPFASRFENDPYAGEIAYTDQCVGEVIDTLKRLDLYESSLIVITADHGEGLGEHGEAEHGYFIYHSTTKVPLIVKLPGLGHAKKIDHTVAALIDIVPTVLGQVGVPVPPNEQRKDLSPLLSGTRSGSEERFIYSESMRPTVFGCSALFGVQTHEWKYIQTTEPELYDLTLDPDEMSNLVEEQPRRAGFLRERLRMILEEHRRVGQVEHTLALDPERIEQLRSLGYTGGPVQETFEFDSDKEDPKSFLEIYNQLEVLDDYVNRGDFTNARRVGEEILAGRANVAQARHRLGEIAIKQGDHEAAIFHYTEALKCEPDARDSPYWHNNLGNALQSAGRFDEAIEHYHQALHLLLSGAEGSSRGAVTGRAGAVPKPVMFRLRFNLGDALLKQGECAEAAREFQKAVNLNPRHAGTQYALSVALARSGRKDEAAAAYQKALQLRDGRPGSGPASRDISETGGRRDKP